MARKIETKNIYMLLATKQEKGLIQDKCDELLNSYRYEILEKCMILAREIEIQQYIEVLLELKNGVTYKHTKADNWLTRIENTKHIERICQKHPRKAGLYIINTMEIESIIKTITKLSNCIDKEILGNLIIETIKASIEAEKPNQCRDKLLEIALQRKCLSKRHTLYLSKAIAANFLSINIDDKLTKEIFKHIPESAVKDTREVNKLKHSKDILKTTKEIISRHLENEKVHERNSNGTWQTRNRDELNDTEIIICGPIWGDKSIYLDSLQKLGWPTMAKSLKINDKDQAKIVFYIHTTKEAEEYLKKEIEEIDPKCRVVLDTCILKEDKAALKNRGYSYLDTIVRGIERKATIIGWSPDGFFGEGISKMVEKCPEGGISCAPVIRVSQKKFFEFHDEFIKKEKQEITNRELAKRALNGEWMHPYQILYTKNLVPDFTSYINDNMLYLHSWTQNSFVYKPNIEFLEEMVKQCKPRYLNPISENIAQFLDHEAFHSLKRKGLVYRCKTSDEFICVEPSDDNQYNPFSEKVFTPIEHRDTVFPEEPYIIIT